MKKMILLLIFSIAFSNVTNDGATLTLSDGVSVYIFGELVNNGTINNEGYLEVGSLSGNGSISGNGSFVNLSVFMPGDVNQDYELNILDVVLGVNIILQMVEYTEEQLMLLDYNNDGNSNVVDLVMIVQTILTII